MIINKSQIRETLALLMKRPTTVLNEACVNAGKEYSKEEYAYVARMLDASDCFHKVLFKYGKERKG